LRIGIRPFWAIFLVLTGTALQAPGIARAQTSSAPSTTQGNVVVVEMFLSQACMSSPPAADYLDDLAERPDLVVLTWHVDYWNVLSNPKYGRWRDPFSKAEFSDRQRVYNRNIRHRGTVFTPQAIVGGAGSAVGSKREAVEAEIERERASLAPIEIAFETEDDQLAVSIDKQSADTADVFLVFFYDHSDTEVKGGDNAGLVFREPNIVTGMMRLGAVSSGEATFSAAAPKQGMGCAVLVQASDQGPVLGAGYCP
jgi:hypothetical protein